MGEVRTQAQDVLEYIQEHGSITRLEALRECGVFELAARISELEGQGIKFDKSGRKKFVARNGRKGFCTVYKLKDTECK